MNAESALKDPEKREIVRLGIAVVLMHAMLSNPTETQAMAACAQRDAIDSFAKAAAGAAERLLQAVESLNAR